MCRHIVKSENVDLLLCFRSTKIYQALREWKADVPLDCYRTGDPSIDPEIPGPRPRPR